MKKMPSIRKDFALCHIRAQVIRLGIFLDNLVNEGHVDSGYASGKFKTSRSKFTAA